MELKEYKYAGAYYIADNFSYLIENADTVTGFLESLSDYELTPIFKFSKTTILHKYLAYFIERHFGEKFRYFSKNSPIMEFEYLELKNLFDAHEIGCTEIEFEDDSNEDNDCCDDREIENVMVLKWVEENEDGFDRLIGILVDETFHLLFRNRYLMMEFNTSMIEFISNEGPRDNRFTKKGFIKRCWIPEWVKKAIFHRDQGRCVFCDKDLTGLYNQLSNRQFDHIVPLAKFGSNDPTNIQLACDSCNNEKSCNSTSSSMRYSTWW